ncbi:hypothetical protein CDCA_CDCA18G4604 [Cyanidium caldarium]|uniref:GRIP domain-containing protein n=1 Tax=Cyanidium caldarium TaxID=2771 RepID=A0AAV9J2M3_CYACA|nr:hypothetical protein CDCA_CDCA18G4604 [Cyanidium caldarium]
MWTTLREQGWARAAATAARQRAGWVATAAREVLEDARAALEEDEGDERREGEDRGDWNLSVDVPSGVGAGSREAAPEKEPAAGWDVSLTPGELEGGRDVSAEVEESDSVKVEEPPQAPTAPSVENPGPDDEVPDVEERREENVPQTEAVEASSEGGEPTAVANTAVAADAPAECSEEERVSVSEATTEAQEKRLLPADGDAPSDEPTAQSIPDKPLHSPATAPLPLSDQLRAERDRLATELEQLKAYCLEREAAVEAMQESYEQTLSEAQMARDQAVARLASFDETELQQTRQKLQRAEARIQTLQDAERNLQAALEGMQWSLEAERRADVERAEQRIAELEARWRECEAERDEARRACATARQEAVEAQAALVAGRAQLAQLQEELAECRERCAALEHDVKRWQAERNRWKMMWLRRKYREVLEGSDGETTADVADADARDLEELGDSAENEPLDRPFLRQLFLLYRLSPNRSQRDDALELIVRMLQCSEEERSALRQASRRSLFRRSADVPDVSLGNEFVHFLLRDTEPVHQAEAETAEQLPQSALEPQHSDDGKR